MDINKDWNIDEVVLNLEAIRMFYLRSLASFSYFNKPLLVEFKRNFKNTIYSLNIKLWQKDKIWQFLNGDEAIIYAKDFLRKS